MFTVQDNVPIPTEKGRGHSTGMTAALRGLQIGQSIAFDGDADAGRNVRRLGRMLRPMKFIVRKQADHYRVWRLA